MWGVCMHVCIHTCAETIGQPQMWLKSSVRLFLTRSELTNCAKLTAQGVVGIYYPNCGIPNSHHHAQIFT